MICRRIEDYRGDDGVLRHNMVFFGVKGVKKQVLKEDTEINGIQYKAGETVLRSVFVGKNYEHLRYDSHTIDMVTSDQGGVVISADKPTSSYADGVDGVCQSLMQRLTLLQGELKHFMKTGFPLLERNNSKQVLDAYLVKTILYHPDVTRMVTLDSKLEGHDYKAYVIADTKYGKIQFTEDL